MLRYFKVSIVDQILDSVQMPSHLKIWNIILFIRSKEAMIISVQALSPRQILQKFVPNIHVIRIDEQKFIWTLPLKGILYFTEYSIQSLNERREIIFPSTNRWKNSKVQVQFHPSGNFLAKSLSDHNNHWQIPFTNIVSF